MKVDQAATLMGVDLRLYQNACRQRIPGNRGAADPEARAHGQLRRDAAAPEANIPMPWRQMWCHLAGTRHATANARLADLNARLIS